MRSQEWWKKPDLLFLRRVYYGLLIRKPNVSHILRETSLLVVLRLEQPR